MGVAFFIVNCIFILTLTILLLWWSIRAFATRTPGKLYQPMTDDRESFMKSRANYPAELDALGVSARGTGHPSPHDGSQRRTDMTERRIRDNNSLGKPEWRRHGLGMSTESVSVASINGSLKGSRSRFPSFQMESEVTDPSITVRDPSTTRSPGYATMAAWERGAGYYG